MTFLLETLGKVGFQWQMALFNLINFLVIFWILKRFAFKPIMSAIQDRQDKANQSVEDFEKAKTELQMAERKAAELVDEAKGDANAVIGRATDDARHAAEGVRERTKKEIELMAVQAKKSIEIDRDEMRHDIQKETGALVVMAVERVLNEKLTMKKDHKLVDEVVSRMLSE